MTTTNRNPVSLAKQPLPGCDPGVDASGQALEHSTWTACPAGSKLIFCFQDACPGCHATGFPALARWSTRFGERLRQVRRSPDRVRGLLV